MKVIGITGGVGAGKSKILDFLMEQYNAYIIKADNLGYEVMKMNTEGYNEIVKEFGNQILDVNNNIDRYELAKLVFNDNVKLNKLEQIIHPKVKKIILEDINIKRKENILKLFIVESALLIQDNYSIICDEIWYVFADINTRIKRLMDSRDYSIEKCYEIINNQPNDEFFKRYTEVTIDNSKDFKYTAKQIKERLNIA